MHSFAALLTLGVADVGEELAVFLGEQDPAFFKGLADGGEAVCGLVWVCVCDAGCWAVMFGGDGAAREDVGYVVGGVLVCFLWMRTRSGFYLMDRGKIVFTTTCKAAHTTAKCTRSPHPMQQ